MKPPQIDLSKLQLSVHLKTVAISNIDMPASPKRTGEDFRVEREVLEALITLMPPVLVETANDRYACIGNIEPLRRLLHATTAEGKPTRMLRAATINAGGADPKLLRQLITTVPMLLIGFGTRDSRSARFKSAQALLGKKVISRNRSTRNIPVELIKGVRDGKA